MAIIDIQTALNTSEMNLDIANDFDGTVNMSDVTELQEVIDDYNASIAVIFASADSSFIMLTAIQGNIITMWENLNTLEQAGQQLVVNVSALEQEKEEIDAELMDIQRTYNILRMNLSYLDTGANQLVRQLSALSMTVIDTTSELLSTTDRVSSLVNDVETKFKQVNTSQVLSMHLTQTVRSAFNSVMEANERARELLVRQCIVFMYIIQSCRKVNHTPY